MEELVNAYFNPAQLGLIYKTLQSGGFIKITDVFGIKIDKFNGFVKIAITVTNTAIDQKVYFQNMNTSYIKKVKPVKEIKEKVKKASESIKQEVDLFN